MIMFLQPGRALIWIRPVADDVAQTPDLVPFTFGICEDRVQRGQIGMYVRDNQKTHQYLLLYHP